MFVTAKTAAPWKKIKTISTSKGQLFGESSSCESHPCKHKCLLAILKKLLYLMNNCNSCCKIVKLTHLPWKNGMAASAFVHLTQYFSNKNDCNIALRNK